MDHSENLNSHNLTVRLYKHSIILNLKKPVHWIAGDEKFYINLVRSILYKVWVLALRKGLKPSTICAMFEKFIEDLKDDRNKSFQDFNELQ